MERISGGFPRDFLGTSWQLESPAKSSSNSVGEDTDSGEVELSLGLSLNGSFGVDPKEKHKYSNGGLVRSSSIASFSVVHEHDFMALTRTCSLPTETEEELRKRKELQSLKRFETKRKRSEKTTSFQSQDISSALARTTKSGRIEFALNGCSPVAPGVIHLDFSKQMNGSLPPEGVAAWVIGQALSQRQRSIGSQGSVGSSTITELDNQLTQEERSPSVVQPLPDHSSHKISPSPLPPAPVKPNPGLENKSRPSKVTRPNDRQDMERNVMEEMPCVTTKGEGPDGKRVEGFLYRYKKGEEVRIVCVCHGMFFTPADFVRHAGGGDVDHPLRHIVVYPTSAALS